MSIFSTIFRTRDTPKNSTPGSNYAFFMGGSTAGKAVTERTAMQMTAVYSCVRILSEAVAGLPLHLYRYTGDGGKEKAIDHPLYTLLHDEPNPEMSSFVFRETLMSHLLLWGNAYAQVIRNGKGEIVSLYPLMPNKMTVDRDEHGRLFYSYQRAGDEALKEGTVRLSPADVGSPIAAAYYREKYEEISNLVDVETVAEMTGYRPLTVNKWCNDGKLRYVSHYPKRWIAKRILIEFLISDTYNSIGNKSEVHKLDLTHIFRRIHNLPDLKEAEEDAQQSSVVTGPQVVKEEAAAQADEAVSVPFTAEAVNTPPVQESPVPAVKVRQAVTQTHSEPAAGHTIAVVPVKKALAPGSSHNAVRVSRSGDGKHEFKPEPQAIKTSTGFSDRQTGMKTTPENGFKPTENARPVVVIKRKTRRN